MGDADGKPDQGEATGGDMPGYGDDIDGKPAWAMGPPKPDQGDIPGGGMPAYGDDIDGKPA